MNPGIGHEQQPTSQKERQLMCHLREAYNIMHEAVLQKKKEIKSDLIKPQI